MNVLYVGFNSNCGRHPHDFSIALPRQTSRTELPAASLGYAPPTYESRCIVQVGTDLVLGESLPERLLDYREASE